MSETTKVEIDGAWHGGEPSYEGVWAVYRVEEENGDRFHYVATDRCEALTEHEDCETVDDCEGETVRLGKRPASALLTVGFEDEGDIPLQLAGHMTKRGGDNDAWAVYVTATCAEWAVVFGEVVQISSSRA